TFAGYEALAFTGVGVARGTPPEIIARLNREINAGLADPGLRKRLDDLTVVPLVFTPAEFGAYSASETEKWAKVIKAANIKARWAAALVRERGVLAMTLHRRNFLQLAAGAAVLPATTRRARALDYPTRPVRLVEGFGAGSAPDVVARLIGQALSERLGQSFVIENRTGSASNI